MVVIPTENQVELTYSKTTLDWFFYSVTLAGIALCFYWRRKGDVVYASDRPSWRSAPPIDPPSPAGASAPATAPAPPPPAPVDVDR
jgi:hypothetical protein